MIKKSEFKFVGYEDGVLTLDMGPRMHDFTFMPDSDREIVISKHYGDHESDSGGMICITPSGNGKFHDLLSTAMSYYSGMYGVFHASVRNDHESDYDYGIDC